MAPIMAVSYTHLEREIGITELSQRVMMSKSTVYRFLQTMKSLGYVAPVSYTHLDVYKRQRYRSVLGEEESNRR